MSSPQDTSKQEQAPDKSKENQKDNKGSSTDGKNKKTPNRFNWYISQKLEEDYNPEVCYVKNKRIGTEPYDPCRRERDDLFLQRATRGDEMPIAPDQRSRETWNENTDLWWPNAVPRVMRSPLNESLTPSDVKSFMKDHPYIDSLEIEHGDSPHMVQRYHNLFMYEKDSPEYTYKYVDMTKPNW